MFLGLETLEANNAAYSQRIDATRSELGWINKRLDDGTCKQRDAWEYRQHTLASPLRNFFIV